MLIERTLRYDEYVERFEKLVGILRNLNKGTDIDGTEVDTFGGALEIVNHENGTDFKVEDLDHDFAMVDLVKKNLPKIQDPKEYIFRVVHSKQNMKGCNPVSGALIMSKFLSDEGINDLHRITSRPNFVRNFTLSWYATVMPWVDPAMIHMQDGGMQINPQFKIDKINDLKLDWFFEDSPGHAESIIRETKTNVLIVPEPWNRGYKPSSERIVTVPPNYYQTEPRVLRAYLALSDILLG